MHDQLYTAPMVDRISGESQSPTRRAERLTRLYADLVERFGPDYPLAVRVKAQRDAARALAGLDSEVRP